MKVMRDVSEVQLVCSGCRRLCRSLDAIGVKGCPGCGGTLVDVKEFFDKDGSAFDRRKRKMAEGDEI